jgi:hypothetical protein
MTASRPAWIVAAALILSARGGVSEPAGGAAQQAAPATADPQAEARTEGQSALEKLKTLAGDWQGLATWDQGGKKASVDFKLSYKVTAAGKVVVETMFPGTPGEMVTTYYLDGPDLVLTHYCTAGNQPRMKREPSATPSTLAFRCAGGTNMKETDAHMHSARVDILDADHIAGEWSSVKDGQLQWVATTRLERVK